MAISVLDLSNKGDHAPTGAIIGRVDAPETATRTIAELVDSAGFLRNRTRILLADSQEVHQSTSELHAETLDHLLRTTAARRLKDGLPHLLDYLNGIGFSWRDVARMAGVSVPALRKWRQGEAAMPENRLRVARLVALCDIACDQYLIDDPASWLETPIHEQIPIAGVDLLAAGRVDLALRLAADGGTDPQSVLDEFDPQWNTRYISNVELFIAPDGVPGLRMTEGIG